MADAIGDLQCKAVYAEAMCRCLAEIAGDQCADCKLDLHGALQGLGDLIQQVVTELDATKFRAAVLASEAEGGGNG